MDAGEVFRHIARMSCDYHDIIARHKCIDLRLSSNIIDSKHRQKLIVIGLSEYQMVGP